jgi:hypothetical protein
MANKVYIWVNKEDYRKNEQRPTFVGAQCFAPLRLLTLLRTSVLITFTFHPAPSRLGTSQPTPDTN